ncbi:polymorphic toxin type 50 domain-containing protein [Photorhabdus sp. P32]|uniref:polymorphic toxin type 50 domain-containing protein n=1 Tax=Photorhabdus sp. P32 TaxID=3117549 RepID=UPI00311AC64F
MECVVIENNYLSVNQLDNFAQRARKCEGESCRQVIKDMVNTNVQQQEEIKEVCSRSPEQCQQKYGYLVEQWNVFDRTIRHMAKDDTLPNEFKGYLSATYTLGMEAEGTVAQQKWTKRFESMGFDKETAGMMAMTLPALTNGKGTKQSVGATKSNVSINQGQQNKHIPGTNEYKIASDAGLNKSIITVPPQTLLQKIGSGQQIGNIPIGTPGSKERINYGHVIGNYIDPQTGVSMPTTNGIVHYSKSGVHIVPARP